jgi:hypothetical protein
LPGQSVISRVGRAVTVAGGRFAPSYLGGLTQIVPFEMVDAALAETDRMRKRGRDLPSRVVRARAKSVKAVRRRRRSGHPRGSRADRWIFGDRASGAYLHRYAWTPIVRHAPVPGRYSPDDPALAHYWADRRRKSRPPQLAPSWERLIRAQHGRCPACGLPLLHTDQPPDSPSQWEQWYRTVRRSLTHQGLTPGSRPTTHHLLHTSCARSPTSRHSSTTPTTADPAPPTEAA